MGEDCYLSHRYWFVETATKDENKLTIVNYYKWKLQEFPIKDKSMRLLKGILKL